MNEAEEKAKNELLKLKNGVLKVLKRVDERFYSYEEALGELANLNLIPTITKEKIIYQDKPIEYQTSEAQRLYLKKYRLDRKLEREREKNEETLKEINEKKIKSALERERMPCWICKKTRKVKNTSYKLEPTKDRGKKIIVTWNCPVCNFTNKFYGGFLQKLE